MNHRIFTMTAASLLLTASHLFGDESPQFHSADFNRDCKVDGQDIAQLLGAWGSSTYVYDLNGDERVDAQDLSELLGAWGEYELEEFKTIRNWNDFLSIRHFPQDQKFVLCNDIRVIDEESGLYFPPHFDGILEGNNKSITHIQLRNNIIEVVALFGRLLENAIVRNLNLEVQDIFAFSSSALAIENTGLIQNVHVRGPGYVRGSQVAGLVLRNSGVIERSSVSAEISLVGSSKTSGFVAINEGSIRNVFTQAEIIILPESQTNGFVGDNIGVIDKAYSAPILVQKGGTHTAFAEMNAPYGLISRSYAVDFGYPFVSFNPGSLVLSGNRSFEEMTSFPRPLNTYQGWDFQSIWTHETPGEFPHLR